MGWEDPETPHFCRQGMSSPSAKRFVGFPSLWALCSCQVRLIIVPPCPPVYPHPRPRSGAQVHFLRHDPESLYFFVFKTQPDPTSSVTFSWAIPAHCAHLPLLLNGLNPSPGLSQSTDSINSFEYISLALLQGGNLSVCHSSTQM